MILLMGRLFDAMEGLELFKSYHIPSQFLIDYLDKHVRKYCQKCKRYKKSASCPPFIEELEYYKNLFLLSEHAILIVQKFIIDDPKNWKELGAKSSESLRKVMERLVKNLKLTNYYCFGGGSCKNCKICSVPCKFPKKRLIPIEGTGLNVVKLVKDIAEIYIKFPVEKYGYFYRVGMILWD